MSNLLGLDLSKNISFFTVPAALMAIIIPHGYSVISAGDKLYDNCNPRGFKETVGSSQTVDKASKDRILRAKAASENGFETIGFYAAAVVAANQARVAPRTLNLLTLTYVASRVAYVVIYVWLQKNNRAVSAGRSIAWNIGIWTTVALWVKAGLNMKDTYVF